MGKILSAFLLTFSLSCFGQTVVESKTLSTHSGSELQEVSGVRLARPSATENTSNVSGEGTSNEVQTYSISSSNRISNQQPAPEPTHAEKVSRLTQSIASVEGKIFLLEQDPEENAVELEEKYAKLTELQLELENIQNSVE